MVASAMKNSLTLDLSESGAPLELKATGYSYSDSMGYSACLPEVLIKVPKQKIVVLSMPCSSPR